jgi:signal transduction histidine kinase
MTEETKHAGGSPLAELALFKGLLETAPDAIVIVRYGRRSSCTGARSARSRQTTTSTWATSSRARSTSCKSSTNILDLAKVESGKMEFCPEKVDLAELVGEVRDVLRGLAGGKRLRLETEIDPGVGPVVVDAARLKQVLYNYLSNAIKFTPERGTITLRVAPDEPECFRLSVTDTGSGIAADDLDRLFVEFQQLDASTAKRFQGTGLGLALTKRIVEAHGGRVEASSVLGAGSTFSAVLPKGMPAPTLAFHETPDGSSRPS